MKRVRIFGGGIAGLTVAHELACRGGFEIIVHDPRTAFGGKARSQYFTAENTKGLIPGEHGFRFFPGWYLHTTDILGRIPQNVEDTKPEAALKGYPSPTVADRLVEIRDTWTWSKGHPPIRARHIPHEPGDVKAFLNGLAGLVPGADLSDRKDLLEMFLDELRIFFAVPPEKRHELFDDRSLADYIEASTLGDRLKLALRRIPKALVAMDGYEGSAVTFLNTAMLNLSPQWNKWLPNDRVLDGPTTESWIEPWVASLGRLGVQFSDPQGSELRWLERSGREVVRAHTSDHKSLEADHFVLALPPSELVSVARASDGYILGPDFEHLLHLDLNRHSGWMVGMQLALRRPLETLPGHIFWVDSPYGLTGVSQFEIWNEARCQALRERGVQSILSLIITRWNDCAVQTDSNIRPPSELNSKNELIRSTVEQLSQYPLPDGKPLLCADDIVAAHVDDDVSADLGSTTSYMSIHPPGAWKQRPRVATSLSNLCLAGEFVRNPADLATMEGACTSGKMAAQRILEQSGRNEEHIAIHDLVSELEPSWMKRFRALWVKRSNNA